MTQSSLHSSIDRTDRLSDLESVIRDRRSVRNLLPDPVPVEVIRSAIETAGWAPSPHGRQPWRFAVVETVAMKTRLADAMVASWQAQLQLDGQDASVVAIRLKKSQRRVITAPLIVVACLYLTDLDSYPDSVRQQAEETMAIQSLGAAVQNFLLHIEAAGYASGWMCAPLFAPRAVREALYLASDLIPHAMLPVGKLASEPVRRPRMSVDDLIVSWQ